jgi:hypothetical protein
MFMTKDFLQRKFLDAGVTRFHFKNKIIINLAELR